MSKVYFASAKMKELRPDASLPAKFKRLLAGHSLKEMFEGKTVAVKMHVGGNLGYSTIHPVFVRVLVNAIKEAGGKPFVTDGSGAIPSAKARGYTAEVLECPIVPAAGLNDNYFESIPLNFTLLEEAHVCGEIYCADAMVVYSHGKGHGNCGWAGAIKNIGMGCVTYKTRGRIHALENTEFNWDGELCTHCYLCRDNCPVNAVSFNEAGEMHIDAHNCRYCNHCVISCPQGAITLGKQASRDFQAGMAHVNKACLDTFEANRVLFINHCLDITPYCDCWGMSSPSIVPDLGVLSGTDLVAVEQASIDSIRTRDFIEGSLPQPLEVRDVEGHLLQKIHGKDPYLQVEEAHKLGLGEREYELVEVD